MHIQTSCGVGATYAERGWYPTTSLSSAYCSVAPYSCGTVTLSPIVTTTYYVNAISYDNTNTTGCCGQSSVVVNVATPNLTASTLIICAGQNVTLTVSGLSGVTGVTYSWSPGGATTSSITVSPTVTTVYTVTITLNSCSVTQSVTIYVNPLPSVTVTAPATLPYSYPGVVYACVCYSPTLTASGASTYAWSPADGLSGVTGSTVTANPSVTTNYTVIGTVTSSGCTNSASLVVYPTCPTDDPCFNCDFCEPDVLKEKINNDDTLIAISKYLKIYPNPNNGNFTLQLDMGDSSNSIVSIAIYNIVGSLIYSNTLNLSSGEYTGNLSLNNNSSGMYFISVNEEQKALHSRFIISH